MKVKKEKIEFTKKILNAHSTRLFKGLGVPKIPIYVKNEATKSRNSERAAKNKGTDAASVGDVDVNDNVVYNAGEFVFSVTAPPRSRAIRKHINVFPSSYSKYRGRNFELNIVDTIAHEIYHHYQLLLGIMVSPGYDDPEDEFGFLPIDEGALEDTAEDFAMMYTSWALKIK